MTAVLGKTPTNATDAEFHTCHEAVVALSREVLKREWNVVKERIQPHMTLLLRIRVSRKGSFVQLP